MADFYGRNVDEFTRNQSAVLSPCTFFEVHFLLERQGVGQRTEKRASQAESSGVVEQKEGRARLEQASVFKNAGRKWVRRTGTGGRWGPWLPRENGGIIPIVRNGREQWRDSEKFA
jgi:hypothetical protein